MGGGLTCGKELAPAGLSGTPPPTALWVSAVTQGRERLGVLNLFFPCLAELLSCLGRFQLESHEAPLPAAVSSPAKQLLLPFQPREADCSFFEETVVVFVPLVLYFGACCCCEVGWLFGRLFRELGDHFCKQTVVSRTSGFWISAKGDPTS